LLCCLSYENEFYRVQNKKMPKLGAEVITPQGIGRVRHLHPLKESVTVILEGGVFAEFNTDELITSKSGASCSTCGGCNTKRRSSGGKDSARSKGGRRRKSSGSSSKRRKNPRRGSDAKGAS
jgi:hypothetical protein